MTELFSELNYVAVLVATLAGFFFGWIWYTPGLFGGTWSREMGVTPEQMEADKPRMPQLIACSFLFTAVSSVGLAVVLEALAGPDLISQMDAATGAMWGGLLGSMVVGARLLNAAVYENRSPRLLRITVGHEIVLFVIQGAILGAWR